jgi:hypothetical protein
MRSPFRERLRWQAKRYQRQPTPSVQIDRPGDWKYDRAIPAEIDPMIRQAVLRGLQPPRDPTFKGYTKITVANAIRPNVNRTVVPGPSVSWVRSMQTAETNVDVALLVCALFLQRFSLTFRGTILPLDFVPVVLILFYQFGSGRLLIQYDRLLWFIVAALAVTGSLLMNFKSTMLSSYLLFIILYSMFLLVRPSTAGQYKNTLQWFQFLVVLLAFLGIAQFAAQLVVDGREIIRFFGIFPEYLFASYNMSGVNTVIPITQGASLIKSNGIFLTEPSTLSQITALGILIEVLEFRRAGYLLVLALGFLVSYSGTGLMTLLMFLPLAGLVHERAGLPALVVILFALGLLVTGIIDLSIFSSRVGEFDNTRTSGFARFVAPFWMAADNLDTASLPALLLGGGPGTLKDFTSHLRYGSTTGTWIKLFYEYGLIGSFVFVCFFASCFRRSRCPTLVLAAIFFSYVFLGGLLLSTSFLIMVMALCTLNGPEPRRNRADTTGRYHPSLPDPQQAHYAANRDPGQPSDLPRRM